MDKPEDFMTRNKSEDNLKREIREKVRVVGARREMREVKLPDINMIPDHLHSPSSRMASKESQRRNLLDRTLAIHELVR